MKHVSALTPLFPPTFRGDELFDLYFTGKTEVLRPYIVQMELGFF